MPTPVVLVVYPGCMSAPGGGAERTWRMCRALQAAGMVLHLVSRDQDARVIDAQGLFTGIHLFQPAPGIRLPRHDKSFLSRCMDLEFDAFARQAAWEIKPAVVLACFAWAAGALAGLPRGMLRMLDTIDIQHLRAVEARRNGVPDFDRYASQAEELRLLRKADALIAIQREEARILKDLLPAQTVLCAEHALEPKPVRPPPDSKTVFFVGSDYAPNQMGITKFVETVWPEIRHAHPQATLEICGPVCAALPHLSKVPGVQLLGRVDELAPYYARAAVVINVALFGTGLPIKTAEAIAYGKCLVCTPPNARGFDRNTFPGMVCEFEAMAGRLNGLLANPAERQNVEASAAAYARKEMTPAQVYGELIAFIRAYPGPPASTASTAPAGLLFNLMNYPVPMVIKHYAGRALSRWAPPGGAAGPELVLNRALLSAYLKLVWRQLKVDHGVNRAAIFGAGQHTAWLQRTVAGIDGPDVQAVLDDHPDGKGASFGHAPIPADQFLPQTVDAIILSSDCFQVQMKNRCRSLFGAQVKLVDLYESLPPGPYAKD